MITLRGALMTAVFVIGASAAGEAQVARPRLPKPQVSCGPFALVLVTVVDKKGAPVTDAHIEVLRERDRQPVPGSLNDMAPNGQYTVIDDMSMPMVAARGENFVVRVKRGKTLTTKVLRIGHTSDGCHVVVLSGLRTIVLPG